jgi:PiT family inorganic phosphate transporter
MLLIFITILMGIAIGWSIGANDAANSLGAAVGSRVLNLKQAIILIAIFGFLGAFLQGGHVVKTISRGIVPIDQLDKDLAVYLALVSCFAGAGLAIGAPVKYKALLDIFICWIFTPVGAAILGYLFYRIFQNTLYRIIPRRYLRAILTTLVISSGCYVAYTWGANDVANATGVLAGAGVLSLRMSIIIGGLAIVFGIVTWGYKVIETIGSEITNLLPIMAFSAQLASAINVHIYTLFGMPVSTSHSIVGAIFGVGLVRGVRVVNLKIMREIIICWLATPFVSGAISFIFLKGIIIFVKK